MKAPAVYILASKPNGTLYIGVTSDLVKRTWQHKNNINEGFTCKYDVHMLVYFEQFDSIVDALTREKQLKTWQRRWKIRLIEQRNPQWHDLYQEII